MNTPTGKIFGLGLSRTATRSLNAALVMLGYPSAHLPLDRRTHAELRAKNYRLSLLNRVDALTDITAVPFYSQFDATYPGSKFILTVRDKGDWMNSMHRLNARWLAEERFGPLTRVWHRFWFDRHIGHSLLDSLVHARQRAEAARFFRTKTYGQAAFPDEQRLFDVFDAHHHTVRRYFHDRPDDLLTIDIVGGEGWERLCAFLDRPIPPRPFPHRR